MTNFSLIFPPSVHFGFGSIEKLSTIELKGNNCLIVSGKNSMKKYGFIDRVTGILKKRKINSFCFTEVEPEVSADTVNNAVETARKNKADIIIGIGGGSAIDCAKAVAGLTSQETPSDVRNYIDGKEEIKKESLFFIAIPSTAGTGSEVTKNAVILYPEKNNKLSLRSEKLVPKSVILDPELTLTMDKNVTAYSGLDALSHAVESYFSKGANDLTKVYSETAINLIFKYLPTAYRDGRNKEARYYMLFASFVAGLSFANAGLGAVHGIGHTIGAVCKIPHGLTNAILLSYVLTFNAKFCPEKLKNLEEKTFKNFIKELFLLNKKLKIPPKYSDVCPDIKNKIGVILSNVSFSGSMSFNPVKITIKEVEKILKDVI